MIPLEEIYKTVEEALKAPRKKCLVLMAKDYEALKKHLEEVTEIPKDKAIGTLKSFNGVNVYCDNSVAFSFSIYEDIYLESKNIMRDEYIIPVSKTKEYWGEVEFDVLKARGLKK